MLSNPQIMCYHIFVMKKFVYSIKSLFSGDFLKVMLPLALPIALQNLLASSLQLVDTLMVGQLGEVAISSVGSAGRILNFINVILFGFASGGAVFLAQYRGSGELDKMRRTYGMILLCELPIAIVFASCCMLFPEGIMRILTNDADMISNGAEYLRIACISYLGLALSQTFSAVLRCNEEVKLPLMASFCSVAANTVLNYVLIFGKLGLPALGIKGAAIATATSALINPLVLFAASAFKKNILLSSLKEMFSFDLRFVKQFFLRTLPVIANEVLWIVGTTGYDMVFGRMGSDNYSALTIFRTLEGISFTFFIGICNACNVMVGKAIGEGDHKKAIDYARRFMLLVPILGLAVGLFAISLSNPILNLFALTPAVRNTAKLLIIIYGIEVGLRNIPYISVVGIFRAGGDTKTGMLYDGPILYFFALPLTAVCGLVFKLDFVLVYIIMLLSEDLIKNFLCIRRVLSNKWIMPVEGLRQAGE